MWDSNLSFFCAFHILYRVFFLISHVSVFIMFFLSITFKFLSHLLSCINYFLCGCVGTMFSILMLYDIDLSSYQLSFNNIQNLCNFTVLVLPFGCYSHKIIFIQIVQELKIILRNQDIKLCIKVVTYKLNYSNIFQTKFKNILILKIKMNLHIIVSVMIGFFLMVLWFEHRASHLLGRRSAT